VRLARALVLFALAAWAAAAPQRAPAAGVAHEVVVIGDSLTAGRGGYLPRKLAQRLGKRFEVVNAGIPGNRVLTDGRGEAAQKRIVGYLRRPFPRFIVIFEGVNDLRSGASAEQLIKAFEEMADRARPCGVRVVAATITPFSGRKEQESERRKFNGWLRGTKALDGILDFDAAAVGDASSSGLPPAFDSGDGLHMNSKGLDAIVKGVDPALFDQPPPPLDSRCESV
jgi:lysophospholipase L1-like esterase